MAKFCTNCGKELQENQDVCLNCGKVTNNNITNNNQNERKSKIAAGLLGIFLGGLGIHNFYLGYTGKAVTQLLITILTCGLGSFISGIWGLIEGIMILTDSIKTDAKGNPLND